MLPATTNRIGKYEIQAELGRGGFGVVYRAFDTLLQRVVAVKVISGAIESGGEQRERFRIDERHGTADDDERIVMAARVGPLPSPPSFVSSLSVPLL